MATRLAQLISWLFHPLLMPTYLFGIIFIFVPRLVRPYGSGNLLLIFLITFCIPLMLVLTLRFAYFVLMFKMWRLKSVHPINNQQALLRLRGSIEMVNHSSIISSYKMEHRGERIFPFFLITIFYGLITLLMAYKTPFPPVFTMIMATVTLISLTLTLITIYWKISIHSGAIGAILGFIMGIVYTGYQTELLTLLALVSLVVGLVMTVRLYLNVHSPAQVWVGGLVGFTIGFCSVYFYL